MNASISKRFSRAALYLTVALACSAQAQVPPPPPPGAAPPAYDRMTPVAQGSVARFLVNPHGEVDGLLLSDGSQVKFSPHMSADLSAAVSPGDRVSVLGRSEYQGVVKAYAITNLRTNIQVAERAPDERASRMSRLQRDRALQPLSVQGRVQLLQYGRRGEVNGVLLDNGTLVKFPPHASGQFQALLQVGQPLAASGYGTENQYGRALEATQLGSSAQGLQPIYDRGPKARGGPRGLGTPGGPGVPQGPRG